jgi:hypothetical protein
MTGDQTSIQTVRSIAEIETAQAGRYLTQLCKHFQHKCPVVLDDMAGQITFAMGDCRLQAEAGVLTLSLDAPDEAKLVQLQDVVARHLLRFAFREAMQIVWRPA